MTFKIMGPLLILLLTFLSHFPVLGMEESSESSENSASSKNVKLKRLLLSKENLPSFNEEFLNLRKQTIKETKKSKKVQKTNNLKENELVRSFDALGYQVVFNETLKRRYQKMGIKFILRSELTLENLELAQKEALEETDPRFNEKLKTLWN